MRGLDFSSWQGLLSTLLGLAIITFTLKGAGPAVLGGRRLPPAAMRVIGVLAAPLLTALVVTAIFAQGTQLSVGAHTAGVIAAGALLALRKVSIIGAVVVAMAVTAGLRAFFG